MGQKRSNFGFFKESSKSCYFR